MKKEYKVLKRDGLYVTHERSRIVRQEIADGSEPGIRFYILVVISTMIAGFGLAMNSTAVIIGAMLVAPLMTPIFGMALALIRGDTHLLGRATRAEIAGVVVAILMGVVLGKLYPAFEPTQEMLSRTQPQLFDLFVAIFSGFAGAYALVDEKISPALPGVAIATAIVPPLANTGLCFAVGAYAGGVGSFLLFFSNFLSILLVASVVFWFFGMSGRYHELDRRVIAKRFGLPIVGFILIALVLTHTLYQISKDRGINNNIEKILIEELSNLPSTSFDKMIYEADDDKIFVLAHANSSTIISPTQVSHIQKRMTQELKQTTELIIQSKIAQNVTALDTLSQVSKINLDGHFIQAKPHPRVIKTKIADSTIRNYLADKPINTLLYVRLMKRGDYIIVVAAIGGIMRPNNETIEEMQTMLRDKLEDPSLRLVVQFLKLNLYDQEGRFRFELTGFVDLNSEQEKIVTQAKAILQEKFLSKSDYSLVGIDYNLIDGTYYFFIEINGSQVFPINEVVNLERLISKETGQPFQLDVFSNIATVVTSKGYESYKNYSRRIFKNLRPELMKDLREIIENSKI
jgi:uncharacterized hydrophobic protein (TIGR00271 family)